MAKSKKETAISKEIGAQLDAMRVYHFRVNSGRVPVRGGWLHLAPTGTPDRFAFPVVDVGGVSVPVLVAIEVKTDEGEVEPAQERTHARIRELGGYVIVARDKADVFNGIKEIERQFRQQFTLAVAA
jgi:hypothetical protein